MDEEKQGARRRTLQLAETAAVRGAGQVLVACPRAALL